MSETKTSIANKAAGMLGVSALNRITDLDTDDTQLAAAIRNVYDNVRRDELRKNTWTFAVRRRARRAVNADDVILTPNIFLIGTTYDKHDLVTSDGIIYRSRVDTNLGLIPVTYPLSWEPLSGPLLVPAWDSGQTYYRYEIVFYSAAYWLKISSVSAIGTAPSEGTNWHEVDGSVIDTIYDAPLSGRTYGFLLPDDFLRIPPRDPKNSQAATDWLFEKRMLLTNDPSVIILRYVRNEEDPDAFDANFTTAFAARLALEACEEITQSAGKKTQIAGQYKAAIDDAKRSNAIEQGSEESDIDEWEMSRL